MTIHTLVFVSFSLQI